MNNIAEGERKYTVEDVQAIVDGGSETIGEMIKRKAQENANKKETSKENEIESSYQDCLAKIYLCGLNNSDKLLDNIYGVKIGLCGHFPPSNENINNIELIKLGNAIMLQFENGKRAQLAQDLKKQGLTLRFGYEKSDIVSEYNPHGSANVTISSLSTMPPLKKNDPLRIHLCLGN